MVVVDQKVGFLGGLDICYGRMDNKKHNLFDFPTKDNTTDEDLYYFPGLFINI
jgi:hypothetical protein